MDDINILNIFILTETPTIDTRVVICKRVARNILRPKSLQMWFKISYIRNVAIEQRQSEVAIGTEIISYSWDDKGGIVKTQSPNRSYLMIH